MQSPPHDPALLPPLPAFARLAAHVEHCGWRPTAHEGLTGPATFRTFQGAHAAPCLSFENGQGQRLLLIGLDSVKLPGDEELFPRFLDMALEERMALAFARTLGGTDWLLLQTEGRIDLHRLASEAREHRVATLEDYETGLLPALTSLARGRERGEQSGARQLPGAESLGGWVRHWSLQLASALESSADHVERVIWKWILMLQLRRRQEGCEAGGGWGLFCRAEEGSWTIGYDAISATEDLCRAIEEFDENFVTRFLERDDEAFFERLRRLDDTPIIDRLRAELLMHSQGRFEPETVAWLFTDLACEQEGWRRDVRGYEPIRKRMQVDGWTVYAPLVCDVEHYGLTAALGDADRLAEYLNELDLFNRNREIELKEDEPLRQPDLFCPNPRGIGATGQLDDGLNYMLGETLRLKGVRRDREFGVGVTFLLKALALTNRMNWPFLGIDTLDRIFAGERD